MPQAAFFAKTTISSPGPFPDSPPTRGERLCRNASLTTRLSRFLSTARFETFFEAITPRRDWPRVFAQAKTKKNLSLVQGGFAITALYSRAPGRRLCQLNLFRLYVFRYKLLSNRFANQALSLVRPFARLARIIARPPTVRILARKPCVRARLTVLGWNVRFM